MSTTDDPGANMPVPTERVLVSSYNPMMVGAAFTHSTSDFGNIRWMLRKATPAGLGRCPETWRTVDAERSVV